MTIQPTPAVSAITRAAQARKLSPLAMIAVAHSESGLRPDAVGDNNHAFGLFQNNNAGGTITGDPNPRRFFNPNVSANYAGNAIAKLGISGLPVEQQIRAIVERYERPAAPEAEVQRSIAYYRQALAGGGLPALVPATPMGKPAPTTPQRAPMPALAPTPAPTPGISPLALAAYQRTQLSNQAAQQKAQDALGAISGHAHGVANPIDLTPYLDRLAPVQAVAPAAPAPAPVPRGKAQTAAPTPVAPTRTGKGYTVGNFEGTKVAAWMVPALQFARQQGWKGTLTSGLRDTKLQAQLYARYKAGGNIAAPPGRSNHEIQNGGAFDATDAQQLNKILQGYKGKKPVWAMSVGLNDTPHFSLNGH